MALCAGCTLDVHTGFGYHGKTGEDNSIHYRNATQKGDRY